VPKRVAVGWLPSGRIAASGGRGIGFLQKVFQFFRHFLDG
jgi:hypothetical protein